MTAPTRRHRRRAAARRAFRLSKDKNSYRMRAKKDAQKQRQQQNNYYDWLISEDIFNLKSRHPGVEFFYLEECYKLHPKEFRFLYSKGFHLQRGFFMFSMEEDENNVRTMVTVRTDGVWQSTTFDGRDFLPSVKSTNVKELLCNA